MMIDSTDRYLYVYGGEGHTGSLNDLWMYDLGTNTWEYITGNLTSQILPDYTSAYPYPGGLTGQTAVIDSTDRYIYLFGGWSYCSSPYGYDKFIVLINRVYK